MSTEQTHGGTIAVSMTHEALHSAACVLLDAVVTLRVAQSLDGAQCITALAYAIGLLAAFEGYEIDLCVTVGRALSPIADGWRRGREISETREADEDSYPTEVH